MYTTCIFCRHALGANEVIEPFPVGRRLAFDPARGRLWVICHRCGRWNLTPLEERWEAIEECERRFRGTRLRVSTENIGLAKLAEGLELVRVGKPLRPEFAAWRYGDQFERRRRRLVIAGGAGAVAATVAAPALVAAPLAFVGTVYMVPWLTLPYTELKHWLQFRRVVAHVRDGHHTLTVRARHLRESRLLADAPGEPVLDLVHEYGRRRIAGADAMRVTAALLAGSNLVGGSPEQVREAVSRIEAVGDPAHFFVSVSHLSRKAGGRVMSKMRSIGALNLSPVERLALEMALHEETERRAMEGELAILEEAWREAEEIAEIADSMFGPVEIRLPGVRG